MLIYCGLCPNRHNHQPQVKVPRHEFESLLPSPRRDMTSLGAFTSNYIISQGPVRATTPVAWLRFHNLCARQMLPLQMTKRKELIIQVTSYVHAASYWSTFHIAILHLPQNLISLNHILARFHSNEIHFMRIIVIFSSSNKTTTIKLSQDLVAIF